MNKSLLISIAIGFAFVLAGIWVYLLIFGAPANTPTALTNLNFLNTTEERTIAPTENNQTDTLSIENSLAQLTTRKVAGFTTYQAGDTEYIRYIEKGNGHIYTINLNNNQEVRTSGTTISGTASAVFSPDGQLVVISTDQVSLTKNALYSFTNDATVLEHTLPVAAENIDFVSTSSVAYTVTGQNTKGERYEVNSNETVTIFSTPFKQITVEWGDGNILVYNNPSPYHKGGIYQVTNGSLVPTGIYGYNLTAKILSNEVFVYSHFDEKTNRQTTHKYDSPEATVQPLSYIPEKCAVVENTTATSWCAQDYSDPTVHGRTYLTAWYKGTIRAKDSLWQIDHQNATAPLQADLTVLTGQEIDVTELTVGQGGDMVLFKNKNNDTLWLYKTGN